VATVNTFYRWAIESGFVDQNPILQRPARDRRWRRREDAGLTPAEAPKDGHREDLAWQPMSAMKSVTSMSGWMLTILRCPVRRTGSLTGTWSRVTTSV